MEGDCGLRRAPVKGLGSTSASAAFTFSAATRTSSRRKPGPTFQRFGSRWVDPGFRRDVDFSSPDQQHDRAMEWVPAFAGTAVKIKGRGGGRAATGPPR